VFGVGLKEAEGYCGYDHESFVEGGCHEGEGAGFDDNRGGGEQGEI